jgi:hypothetical protein
MRQFHLIHVLTANYIRQILIYPPPIHYLLSKVVSFCEVL